MYETSEGKAEPGPDFVISMSLAYARLGVGLEFLFQPDAKHMSMPNLGFSEVTNTKPAIMFITQLSREHQLCICAASTELIETSMEEENITAENRADEISA